MIVVAVMLVAYVGLRHDAVFYQRQLAEVVTVQKTRTTTQHDEFNNVTHHINQRVHIRLLNGKARGTVTTISNSYDSSLALTQPLKPGMQIFLSSVHGGHGWQFRTMKRDATWLPLLLGMFTLVMVQMGQAGRKTVLAMVVNMGLFILTTYLSSRMQDAAVFWLFIIFSVLAAIITLGLVMGFQQEQTWTVMITVVSTIFLTLGLAQLVFWLTNERGMHFELMTFITQLPGPMFMAMTLVGVLGAVMDEATDMIATLYALLMANPKVTVRQLITAGRHVGQEIFGALSNVLFLIFMANEIPMTLLYLRNGNNIGYTFQMNLSLGMIQTLISAIGIVLTVPVGIFWVWLFRSRRTRGMMP
ncbi:YibE/F family protein [Weissella soli]|uniref:YibE/F family protein n=1 Tax=Weissella soli TaxID=155866 RepID=UPI00359FDC29